MPSAATSTRIAFVLKIHGYIAFWCLFIHSESWFEGFLLTFHVEDILITVFVHSWKIVYSASTNLLETVPSTITADRLISSHLICIKPNTDWADIQTRKVSCYTGAESQGSQKITRVHFSVEFSQNKRKSTGSCFNIILEWSLPIPHVVLLFKLLYSNDRRTNV